MRKPLTVISVYNRYLNRGGEDEVFEGEARLLEQNGCRVIPVAEQVRQPVGMQERMGLAVGAIWSRRWYKKFQSLLIRERPDIVHVHNSFPQISPSVLYAAHNASVPVVQTLHNFRMICPKATLFRDGKICEDCVGRQVAWPGVLHSCYQDSSPRTTVLAGMLGLHGLLGTWEKRVDAYIALTEFARRKFVQAGLPRDRITVKPNFLSPDPGVRDGAGEGALFVGRLSVEKGIHTLVEAAKMTPEVPIRIIGDGPLLGVVQEHNATHPDAAIELSGRLPHAEVLKLMKAARFLVFPSEWYEGFPLTVLEAFAVGLPVVASRLGGLEEIVTHLRTGLHFEPGDPQDLADKMRWAWTHPLEMGHCSRSARREYESRYTGEESYRRLMEIYSGALHRKQESTKRPSSVCEEL